MEPESSQHFRQRLDSALRSNSNRQGEFLDEFREFLKEVARLQIKRGLNAKLSASDLVQSVIIDAQKSLCDCRATNREQFKAWLKQIMLNDIVNRFRYLRRQKRNVDLERQLSGDIEAGTATPAEAAIQKENELRLNHAISRLPEDHQQLLYLRHRENLTFTEIGNRMNRSSDAVRMLWNRAIARLAQELKQNHD